MQVDLIPAFSDNYILAIAVPGQESVVLVDPGDADPVVDYLAANELTPLAILVTHHHHDHIGGVAELQERFDLTVYAPEDGANLSCKYIACPPGSTVTLPGLEFSVFAVPGHTLGHIVYWGEGAVFCGDTLFAGGCGRMFEGTPPVFYDSLQKLARLPKETLVYCAHEYTAANLAFAKTVEPNNEELLARIDKVGADRAAGKPTVPSTIALELATNPFLRCEQPDVLQAVAAQLGQAITDPVQVFACLRKMKDSFRS